jgi:hypothetical protein
VKRKFEIVQIEKQFREVGHFGGIHRVQLRAVRITSSGTTTVARSDPIEWRNSLTSTGVIDAKLRHQHRNLIERLLSDGWEPINADPDGFVTSFKRLVRKPITRRFGSARFFRPFSALVGEDDTEPALLPGTSPL